MGQFENGKAVAKWLNAHRGQRVCLTDPTTQLRVVGTTSGIEKLDACSTDIYYGELHTDAPDVQIALTLHDEELSLHLLVQGAHGGKPDISLPLSLRYDQVRLERADAPRPAQAAKQKTLSPEEPEFSPYELLHFPRSH